ncbi:MAG: phosphate ABC transporter permease PstA [Nitrospirota bacterium]|nr:MAG: phosphate ABC transporter permease PstA [Nitrospirota bacterium]
MRKFLDSGTLFVWLCGSGLMVSILMIGGLLLLIMMNGLGYFWPKGLVEFTLNDGTMVLGQLTGREVIPESATPELPDGKFRIQVKVGNRDLYGLDFQWLDEDQIQTREQPGEVLSIERREWGKFFGRIQAVKKREVVLATGNMEGLKAVKPLVEQMNDIQDRIHHLQHDIIGAVNYEIEAIRLALRDLELKDEQETNEWVDLQKRLVGLQANYEEHTKMLRALYDQLNEYSVILIDANGREKDLPLGQIVRILQPNQLTVFGKVLIYFSNVWTVLSDEPREANTEGGIFPAIFGTVMMVLIMSVAVVPFGVLAAIYLKEYARQGLLVRLVRIAVNNLAGVPSIVFGVFGLGFFVYAVGGSIDTLFYSAALPTPTFGTGGILWASLTLALMTVPVVIVATEEGLSAVPMEYREGSLGLGATKVETLLRVVIPCAMPGILTGLILAISRATGEVAPLMLTGVVKLAPSLPLDSYFPFVHLDRKFMHLGFHIYDVGFQSPNVEAAKPMVYVTTLVLVFVVVMLNLMAIAIRNRMRKKYVGSAV